MFRYVHWTQRSCPWSKEPEIEMLDVHDLIRAIISRQRATCMTCKRQNVNIIHSRDGRLRCETCFKKYANSFSFSEEIERVESESLLHAVEQEELYGNPDDTFVDGSDVPRSGEYQ